MTTLEALQPDPPRLLVLDDDPVIAKVFSRSAERMGVAAAWTSNPDDFFRLVAEWRPSHVAIDLSMPGMSGLQVLDRLAQTGCTAFVIVSSGSDIDRMNEALAQARAAGLSVAGALPKPFSMALLRSLLESGLR